MNPKLFQGYHVRGVYPKDIDEELVRKISRALVKLFKRGKMVVGRDARLSSPPLYKAALEILKAKNCKLKIIPVGLITSPMLYFLVNHLKAAGGVIITASHNPKEYNGLKIVGEKAKPVHASKILKLIEKGA